MVPPQQSLNGPHGRRRPPRLFIASSYEFSEQLKLGRLPSICASRRRQSPGSSVGLRKSCFTFWTLTSSPSLCHSCAISAKNALRRGSVVERACSRHRAANLWYFLTCCISLS